MHDKHREFGTVAFHLHDIARAIKFKGKFDLFLVDQIVGEIQVAITFHYGLFGYGYSTQLRRKDQGQQPDWYVRHSLFPRIEPPSDRSEIGRGVLLPKAICHPYCVPFDYRVFLGYGREIAPKLDWAQASENRFPSLLQNMRDFSLTRHAYKQITSRHEKLQFLRDVISASSKRMEIIKEEPTFHATESQEKPYMKYMKPVSGLRKFALTPDELAELDFSSGPRRTAAQLGREEQSDSQGESEGEKEKKEKEEKEKEKPPPRKPAAPQGATRFGLQPSSLMISMIPKPRS